MKLKLMTILAAVLITGCAATPAPKAAATPDITRYRAVVIESVRVAPEAGMLSNQNRQELERQLQIALVDSIPPSLRSTRVTADTLRIQVTVTALDAISPVNDGISTTLLGVPLDRGSIAFEARFYVGENPDPFAKIVEHRKAGHFEFSGSFSHYGHAVGALRNWGTGLAGEWTRT